ncbi:hypothetical protein IEO21_00104 [Rhodonia placenta]|uniref:Cobalamin-independent methionine synthase MetE C-terminal/archaeal domain-containing protein n=1 Tax=Rhodonia placenta TaxID=104341 RepID=A0A8H7PC37_9APHY|nr:hypothetical protein IEO21_00104 [Postia placenta]
MSRYLHLNPPFRAEHIGSLLRPAKVLQKRIDHGAQKCTAEELHAVEDESISAVVRLQQDLGLKTITDGEMRRGLFYEGMFEKLEGMSIIPNPFKAMGFTGYTSVYCNEVKHLKITICGPTWMHSRHGSEYTYDQAVYKSDGADYPALTCSLESDHSGRADDYLSEGSFDRIAVKFFTNLNFDCYYLEYDSERAGSLEPLQYLPLHKTVVLGLVTSKSAQMENLGDIRERVEKAVDIISQGNPKRSREDALNHPQCGFASVFEGKPLSEEDERRKLGLVVEAAKQIWGPHTGSPQAPGQALEKH